MPSPAEEAPEPVVQSASYTPKKPAEPSISEAPSLQQTQISEQLDAHTQEQNSLDSSKELAAPDSADGHEVTCEVTHDVQSEPRIDEKQDASNVQITPVADKNPDLPHQEPQVSQQASQVEISSMESSSLDTAVTTEEITQSQPVLDTSTTKQSNSECPISENLSNITIDTIFHYLVAMENFVDAALCLQHIKVLLYIAVSLKPIQLEEQLLIKEKEYNTAKEEDRLEDALSLRAEIKFYFNFITL